MAKSKSPVKAVTPAPSYTDGPAADVAGSAVVRHRATASHRQYSNVEPGLTVRDGSGYESWDYFRPEQSPPVDPKGKIAACLQAHERFGVIRNTVDMMAEFACQGADVVHTDVRTEAFYKRWWKEVRGRHVCERQLNLLYRAAVVPVKKTWGTLTPAQVGVMRRGTAAYDTQVDVKPDLGKRSRPRRIPWRYNLLSPLSLEVLGSPDVAPLMGETALRYGVRVNKVLVEQLRDPSNRKYYPGLIKQIDSFLSECGDGEVVPVPPDDLSMLWYKKDDWQVWPVPMLFSLFRDLQSLDQLKLADMSALDGAASHVRVWKLGSLEAQMWPSQAAVDKLTDILAARSPGEVMDVVWGPDIELIETQADLHRFLGGEKYVPVWSAIFGGLGVPLSLTGVPAAGTAGATNNWASLKTLVERLEYGRGVVTEFWENEFKIVQNAMGFRKPARLVFDRQSLSDEESVLRLLIELMDRNVVSREAVQERFSLVPEIERSRTRREAKQSRSGKIPPKGGPWDDPQFEAKVRMELIRQQRITPGQAGVELDDDPDLPDGKQKVLPPTVVPDPSGPVEKPKGKPGQGRKPGQKDAEPRKRRTFTPRARLVMSELLSLGVGLDGKGLKRLALDVEGMIPAGEVTPAAVRAGLCGVYSSLTTT